MTDEYQQKLDDLEALIAHQSREINDLSDIVTKQADEIDTLKKYVKIKLDKIESNLQSTNEPDHQSISEEAAANKPPHY